MDQQPEVINSSSRSFKKPLFIFLLFIFAVTLPLTLLLVQQQQNISQKAAVGNQPFSCTIISSALEGQDNSIKAEVTVNGIRPSDYNQMRWVLLKATSSTPERVQVKSTDSTQTSVSFTNIQQGVNYFVRARYLQVSTPTNTPTPTPMRTISIPPKATTTIQPFSSDLETMNEADLLIGDTSETLTDTNVVKCDSNRFPIPFSNTTGTITPSLRVIFPNGADWQKGSIQKVEWQYDNAAYKNAELFVRIVLLKSSDNSIVKTILNDVVTKGDTTGKASYNWSIPNDTALGNYKIRVALRRNAADQKPLESDVSRAFNITRDDSSAACKFHLATPLTGFTNQPPTPRGNPNCTAFQNLTDATVKADLNACGNYWKGEWCFNVGKATEQTKVLSACRGEAETGIYERYFKNRAEKLVQRAQIPALTDKYGEALSKRMMWNMLMGEVKYLSTTYAGQTDLDFASQKFFNKTWAEKEQLENTGNCAPDSWSVVCKNNSNCTQENKICSILSDTTTRVNPASYTCIDAAAGTKLKVSVKLPGIGAKTEVNENDAPELTTRTLRVFIYDVNNRQIGQGQTGDLTFSTDKTNFTGFVNLGSEIATGNYYVKVKLNNTRRMVIKTAEGGGLIHRITAGSTYELPLIELISGDLNDDGNLDVSDYSEFVSILQECRDKEETDDYGTCIVNKCENATCSESDDNYKKKQLADFNNDNKLDAISDFNILLKGFSTQLSD